MSVQMKYGSFPHFQNGNETPFLNNPNLALTTVETEKGVYLTAPLKTTGVRFNLYALFDRQAHQDHILMEKIVYVDEQGVIKEEPISKVKAVKLDSFGAKEMVVGYVSKINNLRWGFNLYINVNDGEAHIETDIDSPIIGVQLRLGHMELQGKKSVFI